VITTLGAVLTTYVGLYCGRYYVMLMSVKPGVGKTTGALDEFLVVNGDGTANNGGNNRGNNNGNSGSNNNTSMTTPLVQHSQITHAGTQRIPSRFHSLFRPDNFTNMSSSIKEKNLTSKLIDCVPNMKPSDMRSSI
jgi:hypothetical protein